MDMTTTQQIFLMRLKSELRHIKDLSTYLALGWTKTPFQVTYKTLGLRTLYAVHYEMTICNQTRIDIYEAFKSTVRSMNDERMEASLKRMEHNELVSIKNMPRPDALPHILRIREDIRQDDTEERDKLYRKLSEQWMDTCIGALPKAPKKELAPQFNTSWNRTTAT